MLLYEYLLIIVVMIVAIVSRTHSNIKSITQPSYAFSRSLTSPLFTVFHSSTYYNCHLILFTIRRDCAVDYSCYSLSPLFFPHVPLSGCLPYYSLADQLSTYKRADSKTLITICHTVSYCTRRNAHEPFLSSNIFSHLGQRCCCCRNCGR